MAVRSPPLLVANFQCVCLLGHLLSTASVQTLTLLTELCFSRDSLSTFSHFGAEAGPSRSPALSLFSSPAQGGAAGKMACVVAAAGMAGVLSSSQLSSRAAFSSQVAGLSGACAPGSVVARGLAVRAAGEPSEKSLEVMRKFSEQYARKSDTFFCVDKGVTAVVVKGLAEHKDTLGAPLCPCRHYDDKVAEVQQGFWNCPCVPMRERKECHCMLFLTPDNDFAGKEQTISVEEISELTKNF